MCLTMRARAFNLRRSITRIVGDVRRLRDYSTRPSFLSLKEVALGFTK